MTALLSIAAQLLLIIGIIIIMTAGCGIAAWRVVYYVCGCRKAPIEKTVLLTGACLWLVSAALLAIVK